jgi:hypothetical protein
MRLHGRDYGSRIASVWDNQQFPHRLQDKVMAHQFLTLLHTAPVHVATFDQLLFDLAPLVPVRHIVDVDLLECARASGFTPDLRQRVAALIDEAFAGGSIHLVCTCSTLGGLAEQIGVATGHSVARIDRAMATQAVRHGPRITVLAALASTLTPTCDLICEEAARAKVPVELRTMLCADAWSAFERGDTKQYIATIGAYLAAAAAQSDVIVLAQASMAPVAAHTSHIPVPVFSSPRLGIEAAIARYRALV